MKKLLILVFIVLFCGILSAGYNWDGRVIFSKHGATKDSLGYLIIELDGVVFDTIADFDTLDNTRHFQVFRQMKNMWLFDTLWFIDPTLVDTAWIVNDGTYLTFDNDGGARCYYVDVAFYGSHLEGTQDTRDIRWDGYEWYLDFDNDAALAYIYFHGMVDEHLVADSTGEILWWMGAGGLGIVDAVGGADTSRWWDDGTNSIMEFDNPFMMRGNYVSIGDDAGAFFPDGEGDLYVEDELEVDGASRFAEAYFYTNLFGKGTGVFTWEGGEWRIDSNNDDANDYFIWSLTDTMDYTVADNTMRWTGDWNFEGRIVSSVSDTIASAATLVLTDYNNFVITGTADIDSIDQSCTFPNWAIAYIEFTGIAAANGLVDGKNLKLSGNFGYTADDMMIIQRRGNIFYEMSRSAN